MEGLFIMTMLVDLSDCTLTLDELVTGLQEIAREIAMEVKVRLAGRPSERKRVAVLVTKEPHCLEQLIRDRDAGKLAGDLTVVLSNHENLSDREGGRHSVRVVAVDRQGPALAGCSNGSPP
jgi:formyltetrahydrofolate deformylase